MYLRLLASIINKRALSALVVIFERRQLFLGVDTAHNHLRNQNNRIDH